jgi:hypothetical protein
LASKISCGPSAKHFIEKRHFDTARKGLRIETAQTSEQIDLVPMRVAQHEHRGYGVIGTSLTHRDLIAGDLERVSQLFHPREGNSKQGVGIS